MTFLSKSDQAFLLGNGPKVVSRRGMVRKQGNGKFTGFFRVTYSDGFVADDERIMNAATAEDAAAFIREAA